MLSAKWHLFRLGLNVLTHCFPLTDIHISVTFCGMGTDCRAGSPMISIMAGGLLGPKTLSKSLWSTPLLMYLISIRLLGIKVNWISAKIYFHSRKSTWNCYLSSCSHFVAGRDLSEVTFRHLISPTSQLSVQRHNWANNNDPIKVLHYWPVCAGNPPVTGGFPAQRASNFRKCFHVMASSWEMSFSSPCT